MNRVPGYEKEMQNIYFCVSRLILLKITLIAIYQNKVQKLLMLLLLWMVPWVIIASYLAM